MAAIKDRLQDVKIDIKASARESLVELLNQTLADTSDLVSQFKQAHWNVRGMDFWQFHTLYDAIHEALEPFVDSVAERVNTLGGVAMGTVRMAGANSALKEFPNGFGDSKKFTTELRDRLAAYAKQVRADIGKSEELGDPTTADLLTQLSGVADLQLYFLESHLH